MKKYIWYLISGIIFIAATIIYVVINTMVASVVYFIACVICATLLAYQFYKNRNDEND